MKIHEARKRKDLSQTDSSIFFNPCNGALLELWKTALLTNYKRVRATFYFDHWRRKSLSVAFKTPCGTITKNKN